MKRQHGYLQVPHWIIDQHGPNIGMAGIAILNVLLRFYNPKEGGAWPGISLICSSVGLKPKSHKKILGAIKTLEKAGLIQVERRKKPNSHENDSNFYRFPHLCSGGVTATPRVVSEGGVTATPRVVSEGGVTATPRVVSEGGVTATPEIDKEEKDKLKKTNPKKGEALEIRENAAGPTVGRGVDEKGSREKKPQEVLLAEAWRQCLTRVWHGEPADRLEDILPQFTEMLRQGHDFQDLLACIQNIDRDKNQTLKEFGYWMKGKIEDLKAERQRKAEADASWKLQVARHEESLRWEAERKARDEDRKAKGLPPWSFKQAEKELREQRAAEKAAAALAAQSPTGSDKATPNPAEMVFANAPGVSTFSPQSQMAGV